MALTDGPPDISATHTWAPVVGPAPPVLGEQGGGVPNAVSWIKVINIGGWRDLPEIIDNRAGRTAGPGEVRYPPRVLGKTVVYQLQVRGVTRLEAQALMTGLLNGFGRDLLEGGSTEGVMTIEDYLDPAEIWTFSGAVIGYDPDDEPTKLSGVPAPYRWAVTVSIRMSDPLFYRDGEGIL